MGHLLTLFGQGGAGGTPAPPPTGPISWGAIDLAWGAEVISWG